MTETGLFEVDEVEARLEAGGHPYEAAHATAIEADWVARSAANPRLYNGRTVLGTQWQVSGRVLSITCREIGYACLLRWLDVFGRASEDSARDLPPPAGDVHFFTSGVIVGSDGRVVMGRMAEHTYNAGQIYMPSGSFDLTDFTSGGVADFHANMRREALEETGIDLDGLGNEPGYRVYFGGNFLAPFRIYRSAESARMLVERVTDYLAGGDDELSEALAFAPGETDAAMPRHVRAFMESFDG